MARDPAGKHVELDRLASLAASYGRGDAAAGEALSRLLQPSVARTVTSFFAAADMDRDDLVQDTLVRTLLFIRRSGGFDGDLVKFTVAVARNRCRTVYHRRLRWAQQPVETLEQQNDEAAASPLDVLVTEEVRHLLQQALDSLKSECRMLLKAYYLEGQNLETIRRRLGLNSVQALHYRKKKCLESAFRFLNRRLAVGSANVDDAGGEHRDGTREGGHG